MIFNGENALNLPFYDNRMKGKRTITVFIVQGASEIFCILNCQLSAASERRQVVMVAPSC